eukprot:gene15047-21121_t
MNCYNCGGFGHSSTYWPSPNTRGAYKPSDHPSTSATHGSKSPDLRRTSGSYAPMSAEPAPYQRDDEFHNFPDHIPLHSDDEADEFDNITPDLARL